MISIIVAVAENDVIGCHNRLIWHISDDLKRFKALTTGHPVVMGRKTFESIGRPLPGRRNIVVSRNESFAAQGTEAARSLDQALAMAGGQGVENIFVIGGGEIYRQAVMATDHIYVTRVEQSPEGDTFFPQIDHTEWREVAREDRPGYSFIDYERTKD